MPARHTRTFVPVGRYVLDHPARHKRRDALAFFFVIVLTLFLEACGNDSGSSSGAGELNGREFLSRSLDGHSLVAGTQIRLSFDQGQISAKAGCNSLSARYQVADGRLVVRGDGMTTTDIGCDPLRHAQDEWLGEFLQSRPSFDLDGDALTLMTADATLHLLDRVVADPDRPLFGTPWRVDTVLDGDVASSVPHEHPVTLEFENNRLTATSVGCTSAQLDVDASKGMLGLSDFAIDAIGCPQPWEATVAVLRSGKARYSITATRLTITAGKIGIAAVAD
jgi:heat shock protein HslJ